MPRGWKRGEVRILPPDILGEDSGLPLSTGRAAHSGAVVNVDCSFVSEVRQGRNGRKSKMMTKGVKMTESKV